MTKKNYLILCLLSVAVFMICFCFHVKAAEQDLTAPVVTGVSFNKTEVTKPGTVNLTVNFIEEGSGLKYINADVRHVINAGVNDVVNSKGWISDNTLDNLSLKTGSVVITIPVTADRLDGLYILNRIYVTDNAGNSKSISVHGKYGDGMDYYSFLTLDEVTRKSPTFTVVSGSAQDTPQPSEGVSKLIRFDKSKINVTAGRFVDGLSVFETDSGRYGSIARLESSNSNIVQVLSSENYHWVFADDDLGEQIGNVDGMLLGNYYSLFYYLLGKYPGKATIKAYDEDGNYTTCEVTVVAPKLNLNYRNLTISDSGAHYITAASSDISSVSNSNSSVVALSKNSNRQYCVTPKKPGGATLVFKNKYGGSESVTITVTNSYYNDLISKKSSPGTVQYGKNKIKGSTLPGAAVRVKINGKTYKTTANSSGRFTVKIPISKVGKKYSITYTYAGTSVTQSGKIKKGNSKITLNNIYRNSTYAQGTVKNAHKGDIIKIKIQGKTYQQKIKKNKSKYKFKIKIKTPGKYGITAKATLQNKYKQTLASKKKKVYSGSRIKQGLTKSEVRWLYDWGKPDDINYYTYNEQWCYDWSDDGITDAYVYFEGGRVTGWQY